MFEPASTTDAAPSPATLAELVSRAAAHWPDRVALVDDDEQLSWAKTGSAVHAMSRFLQRRGVRHADRVMVSVPKSVDAWMTVHALLGLGAVVIPVDPTAPTATADAVAQQANATVLVTDARTQRRRRDARHPWSAVIDIEALRDVRRDAHPSPARVDPLPIEPDDPAYVIFTSGSTGEPKGIVHTHRSALAYAELAVEVHGIVGADRLAGIPPLHFDMSTLELYAAPLVGASVAPVADTVLRFPASVVDHSVRHDVTVWYAVPTLLASLVDRGGLADNAPPSLRLVVYAGEPYGAASLRELFAAIPDVEIHNAYGPAETNVVSVHHLSGPPPEGGDAPIGHPWAGARFDIREGELWVAATTLMDGYLGRPDLTAERTEVDAAGARWYRTGDLVEMGPDGYVFRGRADRQVKVRGVRLEVDAIEAAIERLDGVLAAVVAPMPVEQPEHIVASVLARDREAVTERAVQRHAAELLPMVAVPTDVKLVDRMPTTSSGKVDRNAERERLQSDHQLSTARGTTE